MHATKNKQKKVKKNYYKTFLKNNEEVTVGLTVWSPRSQFVGGKESTVGKFVKNRFLSG